MANGGKRPGAGRKKTLKSEIVERLRDRITDNDFDKALATLRHAMKQRKNLKVAAAAAQFIIEQKVGKAPQSMEVTGKDGAPLAVIVGPSNGKR